MKFIKIVSKLAAGKQYLRGRDVQGRPVVHESGLSLIPCGVYGLSPEQKAAIEARTGCVVRDVVMAEAMLSVLNREPSQVYGQLVEISVDATPATPASNGKPLEKWTKAELQAKCRELEIEFDESATNAQLVELIKANG